MIDKVIAIIRELVPDFEYEENLKLLDSKVLDSFDVVNLVMELNDEFELDIGFEDITEENFETVESIVRMIEAKREE